MATPAWPSDLPQHVLQDGYSERLGDGRLRTQTDWGPGKVRRRYSAVARPVSGQMLVPNDLLARFKNFWNIDTNGGVSPFTIPDQIFDGVPLLDGGGNPILDASGAPILNTSIWLCRFGDPPTIASSGAWFTVSFQLLVLP